MKGKIRNANLKSYIGQNVRLLCNDFEDWGATLLAGGQYDHSLTRTMIKIVLESKDLPAPYTLRLSNLQLKVDEALGVSIYMSPADKWEYMEKLDLTFEDICDAMATEYDILVMNDELPAAKLPTDPSSVPAKYANLYHHLHALQ